jgi:hypothetical protein
MASTQKKIQHFDIDLALQIPPTSNSKIENQPMSKMRIQRQQKDIANNDPACPSE